MASERGRRARICALAALLTGGRALASDPPESLSPAAALTTAVAALTAEAREGLEARRLPRARADFARGFGHGVAPAAAGRKLLRPLDDDPFVDAYVRWQLTGFAPELPRLDQRDFERLLHDLPPLRENPRADRALIETLGRLRQAGPLSDADGARASKALDDLARADSEAAALSLPARQLRAWLAETLRDERARSLAVALERLAAEVAAGWPVERLKDDVERRFEASRWDETFTPEARRRIAAAAARLVGRRRLYVQRAQLLESQMAVEYEETAVDDFDVRRWVRHLEEEET